ncbi:MAG TPA: sugar phosphate isomerase/epimerase family protein [Pirellulales bacterium]|nr:sugar phosphate isomerase/epimerase family protein [Pirellulales bacterium]
MLIGYNTNGLAHHDPFEAIELLAEIGYRSVALTLDHGRLNPFADGFKSQLASLRRLLERLKLRSVVETGARYLLDPRRKHEPTLVSPDKVARDRRIAFLKAAIDAAHELQSDCVSLWSGVVHDGADFATALGRLVAGLEPALDYARGKNVVIGFEPEPGMLIDTMARYEELDRQIGHPLFQLTLDIGHLHCLGETPIAAQIHRWQKRLVNVHIEDMRAGVHEHLMFGEGEIDFPPVLEALAASGYEGGVHVELSRHSHIGPDAARQAFKFFNSLWADCARKP